MVDFNLVLQNENILLRPLVHEDLELMLSLTSDPEMWKYYTHDLSTLEGLKSWAAPAFNQERLQFGVFDKGSGQVMGSTAFGNFSPRDLRLEIGWTWLGKAFHSQGINQQMKQMMLTYCFEVLDLERVEFKTDVLNKQARKSLRNINAMEEGILRCHTLMTSGRRRDTIYYSILKEEWEHVKKQNKWQKKDLMSNY